MNGGAADCLVLIRFFFKSDFTGLGGDSPAGTESVKISFQTDSEQPGY
jgi:hypothetical protein